ncbi:MAG: hypothetical protein A3I83_06000 [Methylotenera sp. RIFCSPLOWO2_02_FULL_45_14]|nr:MAG: hypothetical protein A3I83_06000 [Methylotenera sp. RIFCSPLOWO2_02_FULL_45_14]
MPAFKIQENKLIKLWVFCVLCALSLGACEKEKQASAEVGAVPKQIMDKVTSDINAATVMADERLKAGENLDAPESTQ